MKNKMTPISYNCRAMYAEKSGPRFNHIGGKTAKENEYIISKSLLCQSQGPDRKICILTSGRVMFVWINWNMLNPQVPMNLLPEAIALSLARKKNFTMAGRFAKTSPESGIVWDMTFPVHNLTSHSSLPKE